MVYGVSTFVLFKAYLVMETLASILMYLISYISRNVPIIITNISKHFSKLTFLNLK